MIASNVFRRQIDPFKLFDYIAELRVGHYGEHRNQYMDGKGMSSKDVRNMLHKDISFVKASDIWKTLTDEQKEDLKQRFAGEARVLPGDLSNTEAGGVLFKLS